MNASGLALGGRLAAEVIYRKDLAMFYRMSKSDSA